MKKWSWLTSSVAAVLFFALLLSSAACSEELPKGAIAQVGQSYITESQFDEMKALYQEAGRAPDKDRQKSQYERFEQAVAEYLVMMRILQQQAPSYDVNVTERDVEAEIDAMKQLFQGDEERFEAALETQDLTLEQFAQQTRDRLLLERMKAAVTTEVSISEAEVKAYYESNKSDYVQQERRETRHILIAVGKAGDEGALEPTSADWEAAKTAATKIRAEIQNGADFGAQAQKYSDDESTRESGGKLGPVGRGQMVPAFEEAVFSLKKDEVSQPVKTQYGYHLIQVTEIVPEEQLPYDRVKEGIRTALFEEETARVWDAWLAARERELGVVYRADLKPESVRSGSDAPETGDEGEGADGGESGSDGESADDDDAAEDSETDATQTE